MHRTHSETGRPTLEETRHYPVSGLEGRVEGAGGRSEDGNLRRIEDVTGTEEGEGDEESPDVGRRDTQVQTETETEREDQEKRDREYEERMEDEYAKREGGA